MADNKKKKGSNKTIWILLGVVVVLVIAGLLFRKKEEIKVQTEDSARRTIIASVEESGSIQPALEVKIAPDVSGEVVFLGFQEGDHVKKGDLLVTIRPDNYKSALEQARASLNSSQANYLQAKSAVAQARASFLQDSANFVRNEKLYKDKVISQIEYENFKLQYNISQSSLESAEQAVQASFYQTESAKASLNQARQNLDRTNIFATMDGTVTQMNVEVGERVVGTIQMAGTEIMRVADLSQMEVTVEINENDIINIRIGDTAHVEIDAFENKVFTGQVREIAYSASVSGLGTTDQVTNFQVVVEIDPASYINDKSMERWVKKGESPFRPGMSAQVQVFTDVHENVLSVPIKAVTLKRDKIDEVASLEDLPEIVWVLEEGKVKSAEVETGISDDKYIEILSGITEGQKIITGPYLVLTKKLKEELEVVEESSGEEGE